MAPADEATGGDAGDVRTTQELTRASVSGLRWIMPARVAIELVTLTAMVVLARNVPPAAFGAFALATLVQEVALGVPGEGVGGALVQRRGLTRDHLRGAVLVSLGVGLGLCALAVSAVLIVARPLFGPAASDLMLVACGFFPIGALYAVPVAILRRRLDFARLSLLELTATLVRATVSVVLAVGVGLDAAALLGGSLAGLTAALVLALTFAPPPLPAWRAEAVRELLPYGRPAGLAAVCWTGFRNGDYAIVNARLGGAQAGLYWRGYQLGVEYQRKISTVMTQMAFPVLARTADLAQLAGLRRRMLQLLTVVLFPGLVLLIVVAPELVPWAFGPQWEPAVTPTRILALAGMTTLVIDSVGSALQAAGRARVLLGYGAAHFAFYLAIVLVASRYGLVATCWAAVVSHALFLAVAYVLMPGRTEAPLTCLARDVAPAVVSCAGLACTAVPVHLVASANDLPPAVSVGVVSVAAATGYLAVLVLRYPAAAADLRTLRLRVMPRRRPAAPSAVAATRTF